MEIIIKKKFLDAREKQLHLMLMDTRLNIKETLIVLIYNKLNQLSSIVLINRFSASIQQYRYFQAAVIWMHYLDAN